MDSNAAQMTKAVDLALKDEWDAAHEIVQDLSDPIACWIHAVLHKIEGDAFNSRYWYARSRHAYEEFTDPQEELKYIAICIADE
jgi:hypothetical protein